MAEGTRRRFPALAAAAAITLAGATIAADAAVPVDKVYEGVVSARVVPPKGSGVRATSRHGSATAVLESTGKDAAQLILDGRLERDGDASFLAPLTRSGDDWQGRSDDFELAILGDGRVRGEGRFGGQPMRFDGTWQGNDLRLLVEIESPGDTTGGFPAGTRFQFQYRLRHVPERPESAAGEPGEGGCREVVYRLKLTPNLFGGTMNMVSVPECVN